MEQSGFTQMAGNHRAPFMEHRWGQRMPCRAHVQLSADAGFSGAGRVRDISSSGAFIETALALPVYTRVTLVMLGNASATRTVEIIASVVRVDRDGIGVEWYETRDGSICDVVGCTTRCVALVDQFA
jgi:hypothetical protein